MASMGRMTRKKAAEVAEQLHIDEDDLLELPSDDLAVATKANLKSTTPEPKDRPPLGEIAPNSAESKSQPEDEGHELRKSTRGKKGKKSGAKGKKNNPAAGTATQPEISLANDIVDVLPDEYDSAPSPASEKAAEDLTRDIPELTIQDTSRPRSPPSAAIKLTRSHLKKQTEVEIEPKSLVDGLGQEAEEVQIMKEETLQDIDTAGETNELVDQTVKSEPQSTPDRPSSPPLSAVPNVIARLRNDTPGKRSTSNKENVEPEEAMATPQALNYDELENAVVSVNNTPSRSPQPTPRPEDHIVALDVLNDAVENVSKDIPEVQTSPEKPKKAATPPKKAAPIVRTTKASAARISMAQSKNASSNDPALGRPRQSMALSRASSVRETSSRPAPASKRVISTSSTKEEKASDGEKKEVVIPHSKPRPISMSFPTPPPPPKSTKAPTQSSFQLPGEAVAAKLRAAREARQQKETFEEEKRPAFKARPAPSALSKAPAVRQTNASKARESVMNGKEFKMPTTAASALGAAHRRANSVATTRPSAAATSRVVSSGTTSSRLAALGEKPSARPRPSTSMANISKPRMSTSSTTTTSAQRVPSGSVSGKGTSKGKEVFNRAANAKATADKEKHEREEANKKARAEAAERSRQMSREFAEKQRAKKRAAAGKQGPVEGAAAAVTA